MINFFFLKYNIRTIEEHFQPKIGGKIRISSFSRKNNILTKRL